MNKGIRFPSISSDRCKQQEQRQLKGEVNMSIIAKKQLINYLAICLLEKMGNDSPSEEQINLLESVLANVTAIAPVSFHEQLTPREAHCLYWAALGKTANETGELLNIKSSTVEQHRQEVRKKLECRTMAEAVFKGIRLGYVQNKKEEGDCHDKN